MDAHEVIRFALTQGLPQIKRMVKRPAIHSILSEVGPDESGNVAVWLWIVLDDPPDSEMTEDNRNRIRKAILEVLRGGQFNVMMPVYFFFQTKADRISAGFPT